MNKGQGCWASEYKYVGSCRQPLFGEINLVSCVIVLQSAPKDILITLEK